MSKNIDLLEEKKFSFLRKNIQSENIIGHFNYNFFLPICNLFSLCVLFITLHFSRESLAFLAFFVTKYDDNRLKAITTIKKVVTNIALRNNLF